MFLSRFVVFALAGLASLSPLSALAGDLSLVASLSAQHIDDHNDPALVERNPGIGLEYAWQTADRLHPVAFAGGFRDSNGHPSRYAGIGASYHQPLVLGFYADATLGAMAMDRRMEDGRQVLPAVLPRLSLGWGPARLDATYLPKVRDDMYAAVFYQLSWRVARF